MKCDRYIVKPEIGLVVGEKDRTWKDDVVTEIEKKLGSDVGLFISSLCHHLDFYEILKPDGPKFKSVARCQEGDEYSEKIGMQIVDAKVSYKYHHSMQRKYQRILRELRKIVKGIEELESKHRNEAAKYDDKLATFL